AYDVPATEITVANKVIRVRADGVWLRPGKMDRLLEIDLMTEGVKEITRKVAAFKDKEQAVLFLTVTPPRLRKLMRWTKALKYGFYALWRDMIRDPWGPVWLDKNGKQVPMTP